MSKVKDVAKKLNRQWKAEVLAPGDVIPECPRVSMGSLGADFALYGGVPLGVVTVFSGVQHSGKTLAACQAMAQYQRAFPERTCIYIDCEQTMRTQQEFLVRMTGLITDDEDKFLRYDCLGKSAEDIFQDIIELQQAEDIGCIVLDSAPCLVSKSELEAEFSKDLGMRASTAKVISKWLKQMINYLPARNNALIIINQVREIGKTPQGAIQYGEPCGHGLNYYPSMKVRFGTRVFTDGEKADLSSSKGDQADGFRIRFSVTKSRLGDLRRGGGFLTYRYETGLDDVFDLLEVAIKFDFVHRPNAQMYELINLDTGEIFYGEDGEPLKFRGKATLTEYLNSHEEFKKKYVEMLNRYISNAATGKSLLDDDVMNEILEQENSVENHAATLPKDDVEEEENE